MEQPEGAPPTPTPVTPTPPMPTPTKPSPVNTNTLGVFDQKTIESIKWSAIASAAAGVISAVIGHYAAVMAAKEAARRISSAYLGGAFGNFVGESVARATASVPFSMESLVRAVIMGAIYGAIGGWILAKFFPLFLEWNRKLFKGRLNTFFKLLFVPTVVVGIILFVLSSPFAAATGFTPWILIVIGEVLAQLAYATIMVRMVGKFYPMKP